MASRLIASCCEVDNAFIHGQSADGIVRLQLSASRHQERVAIVVQDQGPGLPADSLEQVLRPFARMDRARGGPAGVAGLGLAWLLWIDWRNGPEAACGYSCQQAAD